jgi:hypothetical protein
MRLKSRPGYLTVGAAAIIFAAVAWQAYNLRLHLGRPVLLSGWVLFALMIALAVFNWRKKLSMVPIGRASTWLALHVVGGLLAIGFFFLHTGGIWPTGAYEQVLAMLFYLTSLSGIVGFAFERTYPRRLTHADYELIYERIPAEIARLREAAEKTVLDCTTETGSDTLARHYLDTLSWYFRRPRFGLAYLVGSDRGDHWLRQEFLAVERYLNEAERKFLARLRELGFTKTRVDRHYAGQTLLKYWLIAHVPLAAAVMVVTLWHVLLVHIYAV